jgi:hypothetical protein
MAVAQAIGMIFFMKLAVGQAFQPERQAIKPDLQLETSPPKYFRKFSKSLAPLDYLGIMKR